MHERKVKSCDLQDEKMDDGKYRCSVSELREIGRRAMNLLKCLISASTTVLTDASEDLINLIVGFLTFPLGLASELVGGSFPEGFLVGLYEISDQELKTEAIGRTEVLSSKLNFFLRDPFVKVGCLVVEGCNDFNYCLDGCAVLKDRQ
ncbi:hypothetical protein H6P81_017356 [Aristolochia fimbriata]|uniref:Uncharacterized protein n=1 Tax=Aristolochia fimbriata TaxID=158543 RepID=A0AAV7DY44_ARIFI|nr:hypothetical protein H6P81_017356 [Aristolochia fimbriata]